MSDKKKTDSKKIIAICLGIIVVVFAVALAGMAFALRPEKLSQSKMQANMEAAEKVYAESIAGQSSEDYEGEDDYGSEDGYGNEDDYENEEGYSKELPSFEVASGGAEAANATKQQEDRKEEEEGEIEEGGNAQGEEYLCSYSAERLMTEEDVEALKGAAYGTLPSGKGIIQMVINEMYAKHGYQFENQEIQAYFDQQAWYQNINTRNTDMDDIFQGMSDVEKKNVEFLNAHNGEGE